MNAGKRIAMKGPIATIITEKLVTTLAPVHLEVINESYKHNVPTDSESHFKIMIVSSSFQDKSLIERHRIVNTILKDELKSSIHALSIQAKTPSQYECNPTIASTPNCLGGSKH